MRTSRDLLRPLAALVVVVATVALASNVAAYRAATTPHDVAAAHDGDHPVASAETSERRAHRADDDGDGDGRGDDDGDSGGRVVVVTESGAS
ncbi:MAG: hypothetical protein ABEJ06_01920 [Haloarculaceae archaeon]